MLDTLFAPRGIAVIGASRDRTKLGYGVARNLVASNYNGAIHLINPNADRILGQHCYPSIEAAPDPIDLVVVIVPAPLVPHTIDACGRRGIRWAIIVSGGFRETDRAGAELEEQIVAIARRHDMRLIGPNCIGLIDTHVPFNTTFIKSVPNRGEIAFVSQSGAICQAVIDWGTGMGFGFSRIASLGNQADLSEAEVLTALASDPNTRVITMYLEGVKDGAQFKQAASEAARDKSIVALKVGRTAAGKRAVTSHTGALAGQETAYDVVFDRYGILRASSTEELFDWARALAWCPPLRGDRVAVLTNAGGPGILAVDALEANGLRLADLSDETVAALRSFLLPHASFHNPIDMLASAGPTEYAAALQVLVADEQIDAVLVISVPPPIEDPTPVAEAIAVAAKDAPKPVVVAVMGEATVGLALKVLRAFRLTDYRFPERAASALGALWRNAQWRARPADQPTIFTDVDRDLAAQRLASARSEWLTGTLAASVLQAYGITGLREAVVTSAEAAVQWAEQVGYPIVLKIASPQIPHKSDIGGVALDLNDASAVRAAFEQILTNARRAVPDAQIDGVTIQPMLRAGHEVIVGAVRDAQFGPLIMFGAGGVAVEGKRDVAFGLAPLSRAAAETLIDATFAGKQLRGFRGSLPADRAAVIDRVLRLAQFIADFPQVIEVEINPLHVLRDGAAAIDVRLKVLRDE
ncbi:MAG: acetate--CoA ligase family protein [Chloroflexi bacterium]|nr:acetate--CoA ligase family protein [Chloroflexota bacterium]